MKENTDTAHFFYKDSQANGWFTRQSRSKSCCVLGSTHMLNIKIQVEKNPESFKSVLRYLHTIMRFVEVKNKNQSTNSDRKASEKSPIIQSLTG